MSNWVNHFENMIKSQVCNNGIRDACSIAERRAESVFGVKKFIERQLGVEASMLVMDGDGSA